MQFNMSYCVRNQIARTISNSTNFEDEDVIEDLKKNWVSSYSYVFSNKTQMIVERLVGSPNFQVCSYSVEECIKALKKTKLHSVHRLAELLAGEQECKLNDMKIPEIHFDSTQKDVFQVEIPFSPDYCMIYRLEELLRKQNDPIKQYIESFDEDKKYLASKNLSLLLQKMVVPYNRVGFWTKKNKNIIEKMFFTRYVNDVSVAFCEIPQTNPPDILSRDSVQDYTFKLKRPSTFDFCKQIYWEYFQIEVYLSAQKLVECKDEVIESRNKNYTAEFLKNVISDGFQIAAEVFEIKNFTFSEEFFCYHEYFY